MFVLAPPCSYDLVRMLDILHWYDVKTTRTLYDKKELIVVDGENREGDERLAEWAFQANFKQKKTFLCPICTMKIEETGEGSDTCGHLTFTNYIRRD